MDILGKETQTPVANEELTVVRQTLHAPSGTGTLTLYETVVAVFGTEETSKAQETVRHLNSVATNRECYRLGVAR